MHKISNKCCAAIFTAGVDDADVDIHTGSVGCPIKKGNNNGLIGFASGWMSTWRRSVYQTVKREEIGEC